MLEDVTSGTLDRVVLVEEQVIIGVSDSTTVSTSEGSVWLPIMKHGVARV